MISFFTRFLSILSFSIIGLQTAQAGGDTLQPRKIQLTLLGVGTQSAQVALLGNVATYPLRGVQLAAIFNTATQGVNGMQGAAVFNYAADSLKGAQLSGCINAASGRVDGIQAAGSINLVDGDVNGLQAAGAANIVSGNSNQCQLSGGINIAKNVRGLQAAGGANLAKDVDGLQAAGGLNVITGTQKGFQVSGGLNVARNVKGVQLGVVNFSDSCSGVPIGVFSFVRTGYHKIQMGYNEVLPVNVSFRSGTSRFYNIVDFGVDFRKADVYWAFGYGIGTEIKLHRLVGLNIDITNHHVNQGSFSNTWSDLYKLHTTFDFKPVKNVSMAVGPTLNVFANDVHPGFGEHPVTGFAPWYFFSRTYSSGINVKSWIGIEAAIRFF